MKKQFDDVREACKLLEKASDLMRGSCLQYYLDQLLQSYDLLMGTYAPFKVGDRVQLSKTPVINEKTAPGWRGSEHFLVKGAAGEVAEAECVNGKFRFSILFDQETYIHPCNKVPTTPERRGTYSFGPDYLEPEANAKADKISGNKEDAQ